MMKIDTKM
ncbi:hypothetical protein AVEN_255415-1, partial [Araneus ventricosus]